MYSNEQINQWLTNNPNATPTEIGQIMYQNGVSPQQVSQATGKGLDYVTNEYNKANNIAGSGLNPAYQTLKQGGLDATARIDRTQQEVGDIYERGLGYLNPYMQTGNKANDLQAALSGSMGAAAQQQAFNNYQQSPGVAFAQQEGERALLRNASATGGLGGGNVLRDLTKLAAGTFMQDYNNQFQQIGQVADRGYGAATTGAGLEGQQGQVQAGLGQFAANIPMRVAEGQAGMQFQAGRDIGNAVSNTTTALSNLINQQGAGMADMTGNNANNINSLYQSAMGGDANAKEQLAALLSNLSTNNASMQSSLPQTQQQGTNYLGQLGQVASGVGGLAAGLNGWSPQQTPANQYGPLISGYGKYGQ